MSDVDLNVVCQEAANSTGPILLVGQSRTELSNVAERIHEIALAADPTCRFGTVQCQGLPVDRVNRQTMRRRRWKPFTAFRVRRPDDGQDDTRSDYDVVDETRPSWLDHQFMVHQTLHFADVERASDEVAWAIHNAIASPTDQKPSLIIASSTACVADWPRNALLDLLKGVHRVAVAMSELEAAGFRYNATYSTVGLGSEEFELTPNGAAVIQTLHSALQDNDPWVHKDTIRKSVDTVADPFHVRDCFDREVYKGLVRSRGSTGYYRLRVGE